MHQIPTWLKARIATFTLLPDYGKATAKQWMNILFGETVVGTIFLIWWALTNPRNPPLILIFVVAVIVAGYFVWRADHIRLIPKLAVQSTRLESTRVREDDRIVIRTFCQIVPTCLTEGTVYECVGHLQAIRKWVIDSWQDTALGPMILQWGHSREHEATLHKGAENVLNIFFIQQHDHQIIPCVDADIDWPQIRITFCRLPGDREAYQFDISITYSQRVNGNLENMSPIYACLEAEMGDDPYNPVLRLSQRTV